MELTKKELKRLKQEAIDQVTEKYLKDGTKDEKIALGAFLEELLDAVMRGERKIFLSKDLDNKGNGFYERTLSTALGKLGITVPRDRKGEFKPAILPGPWVRSTDSYEQLLSSLVVNGLSKSNISRTLKEMGVPYSEGELEKVEEEVLQRLGEFKTRELPKDIFCLYIDGYLTQIKEKTGCVRKYCIYVVLGVDLGNFKKEIYGFYLFSGSESKGDWIKVFQDLIGRGLKRVLLIVSDDLPGLDEAISAIFERTDHQLCFIHLQRNVRRNMTKNDAKEFNEKLKEIRIYSKDHQEALAKLEELLERFHGKYPSFIEYLSRKKEKYLSFTKYPKEVRGYIYTTNAVESFISMIEKIRQRLGGYFQSEDILGVNILLQYENLRKGKWREPIPKLKAAEYEINQMFRLRFVNKE